MIDIKVQAQYSHTTTCIPVHGGTAVFFPSHHVSFKWHINSFLMNPYDKFIQSKACMDENASSWIREILKGTNQLNGCINLIEKSISMSGRIVAWQSNGEDWVTALQCSLCIPNVLLTVNMISSSQLRQIEMLIMMSGSTEGHLDSSKIPLLAQEPSCTHSWLNDTWGGWHPLDKPLKCGINNNLSYFQSIKIIWIRL